MNRKPGTEGTKRIMIVESDTDIAQLAKECLGSGNYTVELSPNGEACLEALDRFTPDLLILDVMMPGLNGWEVLDRLVGTSLRGKMKIVMFTTSPLIETLLVQKGVRQTVGYIRKPFTVREFLSNIEQALFEDT